MSPFDGLHIPAWVDAAACVGRDPELWFAAQGDTRDKEARAKAICRVCPVRTKCLEYALEMETDTRWGVYGGLNPDERRKVMKKRRAA